jgi:hypothetical protein
MSCSNFPGRGQLCGFPNCDPDATAARERLDAAAAAARSKADVAAAFIEYQALWLIERARALGLNVSIETRSLQPLAMRNYELAVTVWPRRES